MLRKGFIYFCRRENENVDEVKSDEQGLQDELGSVVKLIGEDGKKSSHYNYDEFGRPDGAVKFDPNWLGPDNVAGYTGYSYDYFAGLYYANARYYLPEVNRFISEDPWNGTLAQPNTLSPYPYVLYNPLKYVDPLGLSLQTGRWGGDNQGTSKVKTPANVEELINMMNKRPKVQAKIATGDEEV